MNAEVVLDGLVLGESPRWHDGRLWVADWAAHELVTLDAGGIRQVAEHPASIPCCIDWLPDGRLLLVSGDRLLRREPDGTMVTHAELAQLDPHPWNDIAVDSQGNAFVGCIGFDSPPASTPRESSRWSPRRGTPGPPRGTSPSPTAWW